MLYEEILWVSRLLLGQSISLDTGNSTLKQMELSSTYLTGGDTFFVKST